MFEALKKTFSRFAKKLAEEPKTEVKKKEVKGIIKRITETKISEVSFNKLFQDLELELLQNNVAYEVVQLIKSDLKESLLKKGIKRVQVVQAVKNELKKLILDILKKPAKIDLTKVVAQNKKAKKPTIILLIGVNGVGKTTTMAKVAKWLQSKKFSCVFAASDTFRAAAIEQLQKHADVLKIEMISHKYGADAAAVAYDAIEHAKARGRDVVLIDTAGRQHANVDLMAELQKVKKVTKPDLTILTVDALTGNDAVEQAKFFDEQIGIDGSILAKIDTDERGGALISVAYITKKPILFLGVGQRYKDLEQFDAESIVNKML